MKGSDHHARALAVACALVLVTVTPLVAADPPVRATVTVSGAATPGATITATAAITTTDGSTVQNVAWRQIGGVTTTLAGSGTAVSITLPNRATFKHHLMEILEEPPIAPAQYPAHIPQQPNFEGGLQNRFYVIGIAPLALEHASALTYELTVTTTSGVHKVPATVTATLPWPHATGIRNVPIGSPVLLQGKSQASYNWTIARPATSTATIIDATTRHPEFVPDVAGTYEISVNDIATGKPVTLTIHAGTWKGIIRGADSNGAPLVDFACTSCHTKTGPLDMFTPWARSGHAAIFTQNVVTPNGHYSSACLSCHMVGFDPSAANGGVDEAENFAAFATSPLLTHGDPLNWSKILSDYPAVARMSNIQCENCHGPQNSAAHMKGDGARMSLSAEVCSTCHGEPLRHGRFQQWQISKHSNYELAVAEGTDPTCSKCHSAQGYVEWSKKGFSSAALNVTWTEQDVHPLTCATCHEVHDVGSTSGGPTTNARMRVAGATPALLSGFTANDVGSAAVCMTCHNGRRGLRNDTNFSLADASRAPHLGPQTDVLMGENMYFVSTGKRGFHSLIQDSCVTCHMESTAPPAALSYNGGGTNHAFYASKDICKKCHQNVTAESVQEPIEAKMEALKLEIEKAIRISMQTQLRLGNSIDLGGQKTVRSASDIAAVDLIESHGRQGVSVTLADRSEVHDIAMNAVKVVRPGGSSVDLYAVTDPNVAKGGWNYFVAHADKSHGVHNPTFVNSALDVALFATRAVNIASTNPTAPISSAAFGGGVGNFQGAVSCTTPFVYWAEIAGRVPGAANSQWRTDIIARNLGTERAQVRFILHDAQGDLEGHGVIDGSSQQGFEDIVGVLGANNRLGSLEICSNQPLLVTARVFNKSVDGTFGQNIDGHVADLGYSTGQTVSLIGLRQKTGEWRTNLSITNGGKTEAQVLVTLFSANGTSLTSYTLAVPAGRMLQDLEPFKTRISQPDIDWGYATVTVVRGTNIRTMGTLIDMKTNDPTTIPAKQ